MTHSQHQHWDVPIDYWERGPVRKIIDLAFDAVVIRIKQKRPLNDQEEQQLRERVLPQVVVSITERTEWSIDAEGNVLREHEEIIEAEIERHVFVELGEKP